MLAFFVKNKKSNGSTDRRRGDYDEASIDINSNENRNKTVVTMISPWLPQ